MTTRIQQLPTLVINQIAAGEVIERPASVVKELLENSVDAGATRIEIDVEQGGQELVRIVDDGSGIYPEDLPLVFASHATSKLRNAEDLFSIGTFGFRGEALASIGGVAQVTVQSRPGSFESGAMIECLGSQLSPVRPWNGSPGTRIEVRRLFFNTPVRRKFLRTPATEMGHISETVTRLALAHARADHRQGLHLVLRHNNRLVHELSSTATLLDRIEHFYGPEVAGSLYEVENRGGPVRLFGYIADPACDRGHARMQYQFINGRWIRDRSLGHAIQEAYRGLLMTGRYAVAFLFIEMPADQVDVNVHPTKSEVRFRHAQALHHLVYTTIKARLRQANLVPRLQSSTTIEPTPARLSEPTIPLPLPYRPDEHTAPAMPMMEREPQATSSVPPQRESFQLPPLPPIAPRPTVQPPPTVERRVEPPLLPMERPDPPRALQLYDCYLVVETAQGMLVIDQHALHERILFDQFRRRIETRSLETQALLIPEPVDLPSETASRILEHRAALSELGLGIEDFGGGTVLLTRYPVLIGRASPRKVLLAVVDHLMSQDRLPAREVLFNNLLSLMACHSAVRAGERLGPDQMNELLAQRHLADDHHHCPHGRPTALLFTRQDLEKQFRRV